MISRNMYGYKYMVRTNHGIMRPSNGVKPGRYAAEIYLLAKVMPHPVLAGCCRCLERHGVENVERPDRTRRVVFGGHPNATPVHLDRDS